MLVVCSGVISGFVDVDLAYAEHNVNVQYRLKHCDGYEVAVHEVRTTHRDDVWFLSTDDMVLVLVLSAQPKLEVVMLQDDVTIADGHVIA